MVKNRLKNLTKLQKIGVFALSIVLIVSLLSITGTFATGSVYDAGTGDTQYQELLIDNTGGAALTTYQFPTTIEYDSNMQTDFDDIVFAELDGTILKHYKMSYTDSTSAKVYILIDCDADSTKKIAMFYGNPTMSDTSDSSMFELFDHFEGGSVDGAKWECTAGDIGTVTVSNSKLQMSAGDLTSMKSIASFSCPVIVESSHAYGEGMFGILDSNGKNLLFYNVGGGSIVQVKMTEGTEQFGASGYSPNVLQDKKIVWASDYVQFYINDVAQLDPAKTSLITTDDMRIYWQDVPHSTDDGIFAFDWILVRKYVADEPTVTFQKTIPYDIDKNNDVVIPVSVDASETITKYLLKPDGYSPNPNAVYISYFNGDSTGWTEVDPNNHISFTNDKLEFNSLKQNERAYVYQSNDVSNENLKFSWTSEITSADDGVYALGVWNTLTDFDNINTGFLTQIHGRTDLAKTYSKIFSDTTQYNGNGYTISLNTVYYLDMIKDDNTITCKGYSDESRTNLIFESTVTQSFDDSNLNYIYLISSEYGAITDSITGYIDDFSVRKYTENPPTAIITDMGTYYKLDITNNEASALSGYQMTLDGTELGISTQTDSLLITDNLPTTLSEESITPNSTTVGNSVILSATFSDTIADATATITKPDASNVNVDLSNSEGNTWIVSLSYTELGNYTIDDYKINSELKTLESGLTFEITAVPSTPSGGGGGSSSTPAVTETIIEENTIIVTEESEQIKTVFEPYTDYMFIFIFIIMTIIVVYLVTERRK